jgi:hypothetical protein
VTQPGAPGNYVQPSILYIYLSHVRTLSLTMHTSMTILSPITIITSPSPSRLLHQSPHIPPMYRPVALLTIVKQP